MRLSQLSVPPALKKVSLWGWAIFLSVSMVILGVIVIINFTNHTTFPVLEDENPREEDADALISLYGKDMHTDFMWALQMLYGDDKDAKTIAESVVYSLVYDVFGKNINIESSLDAIGVSPYIFTLYAGSGGIMEWTFILESTMDTLPRKEFFHLLDEGFLSQFSSGVIRTRTVPSGNVVQDVVPDTDGVYEKDERISGYIVREMHHSSSGRRFVHAVQSANIFSKNRRIILSNSRERVVSAIDHPIKIDYSFWMGRAGFDAFMNIFPESDMTQALDQLSLPKEPLRETTLFCSL